MSVIVGDDEFPASGADAGAAEAARRELGEMLAGFRQAAGLSLRELGRMTGFHHTVIAHSEKGRPAAGEAFWKLADNAVNGGGTLTAGYDRLRNLELAEREKARQAAQAAREERAACRLSREPPEPRAPAAAGLAATAACPHCRQPIELVPLFLPGRDRE